MLKIGCSLDVPVVFFRQDYILLCHFGADCLTLQIKDEAEFTEQTLAGDFAHFCYDTIGLNLFLLSRSHFITAIDCRNPFAFREYLKVKIPCYDAILAFLFSEELNKIIVQTAQVLTICDPENGHLHHIGRFEIIFR